MSALTHYNNPWATPRPVVSSSKVQGWTRTAWKRVNDGLYSHLHYPDPLLTGIPSRSQHLDLGAKILATLKSYFAVFLPRSPEHCCIITSQDSAKLTDVTSSAALHATDLGYLWHWASRAGPPSHSLRLLKHKFWSRQSQQFRDTHRLPLTHPLLAVAW